MPTYEYECTLCNERFEVFQKISEEPLTIHEGCGGELRRVLYPVGIVFKGPGFHVNDYGSYGRKNGSSSSGDTEKKEAKPSASAEPAAAKD